MRESDMFEPVKNMLIQTLGCKKVFAEVALYDVVGLLENVDIVVEMKKQMSFKVIEQAIRAIGATDYVFVAIPEPKADTNRLAVRILKQEGIGLIYIKDGIADIKFWGRRHRKSRKSIRNYVLDHHQNAIGGVKSGEGPTEYSVTMERIKYYMRRKNWVSVDEIVADVETHYHNPRASVGATLKASWNADWCEHKKEGRKTFFRLRKQEDEKNMK